MKDGAKKVLEVVGTVVATLSLTLEAYCEYKKSRKKIKKKKKNKGGYYYDGPQY